FSSAATSSFSIVLLSCGVPCLPSSTLFPYTTLFRSLLIVCVNVGNLLLLRASLRAPEIVIRRALGASSRQIGRLLVAESALLATAGGALGLVCAGGLLHILLAFAPAQVPRTDVIRLAGTPVDVAAGVTLLAVMLFGVLPALLAAR